MIWLSSMAEARPPYVGSCRRDPVQTCYDYFDEPTRPGVAYPSAVCDLIAGVFSQEACPTAGETGRCDLPGTTTHYYGRTTTRGFGMDLPVDRLCVRDGGTWVVAPDPVFTTIDGRVNIQVPAGWHRNEGSHPFDLQLFAPDRKSNLGLFVYPAQDLAAGASGTLLQSAVDDLRAKRANFTLVEAEVSERLTDRVLTTVVYVGENEALRSYYRFTLIDFDADGSPLVTALQVVVPSEWARAEPVLAAAMRTVSLATAP